MERFDHAISKQAAAEPQTNGHTSTPSSTPNDTSQSPPPPSSSKKHKAESSDELSSVVDSPKPKKKRKVEEDSDAAYAAKLQAMENQRARATRGGGVKASKPVKKKSKKKSAGRVKAEDDSDLEGTGSEVKERKVNRNTGFHVSFCRHRWSAQVSQKLETAHAVDTIIGITGQRDQGRHSPFLGDPLC